MVGIWNLRLVEVCKALAAGALLAVVGGWIGIFCTTLGQALATKGPAEALVQAISVSLLPLALGSAIIVALPATALLLPAAYYLTRRRIPVTPPNYALIGSILAQPFHLPRTLGIIFGWDLAGKPSIMAIETHHVQTGMAVGIILAGAVCGWLFGMLIRNHYERFRLEHSEVT